MTGYSFASLGNITVEVRSINHRFFEFNFHGPSGYAFLEDKLRTLVKKAICRGKIDVFVRIENLSDDNIDVNINFNLAAKYVKALNDLNRKFGIDSNITAVQVLTLPNIIKLERQEIDENEVLKLVLECANTAICNLICMKETEGKKLKTDIKDKLVSITNILTGIKKNSFNATEKYKQKLEQNIKNILNHNEMDFSQQRILTEVAIFADKVAIDEEIVRLESHIEQMDKLLLCDGSIGKKMDFIIQEMNRETNTIGSKCSDICISRSVIEIKATLEKIREQVQNIE